MTPKAVRDIGKIYRGLWESWLVVILEKSNVLVVADVGLPNVVLTGGVLRSTRSIKEYTKHFYVNLVIQPRYKFTSYELQLLKNDLGVQDVNPVEAKLKFLNDSRLAFTYIAIPPKVLRMLLRIDKLKARPKAIVVLNEPSNFLSIGKLLKEEFNVPSLAMIQLPLFYSDKRRREAITNAFRLWFNELYRDSYVGKFVRELRTRLELLLAHSRLTNELLKSYDVLIAVSKAVFIEMGGKPLDRFYVMDPGVSLNEEDEKLMSKIKENLREKGNYMVFGGRVDALKGFVEALYAFREISRRNSLLKLVITGYIGNRLRVRVEKFVRRLGLEDRIVLTGNIPRAERFRIVANANLMLYPSHVDSFPYSILESLYLGTPVVAYNIPALKLYYGGCSGVRLVKEGDIEALVAEALNTISSKRVEVEPPKLRSWNEIMQEETNLIKRVMLKK
ncbi:MAG: glycosyltransferase family 4 protein [Conexivisphaerales archaeon]